jgi:hypothetical protein
MQSAVKITTANWCQLFNKNKVCDIWLRFNIYSYFLPNQSSKKVPMQISPGIIALERVGWILI